MTVLDADRLLWSPAAQPSGGGRRWVTVAGRATYDLSAMEEMQRARLFVAGDDDAYAAVFREFRGPVFGIALHALADPGLAEEALQLAFLAVWRSRSRFDPARPLAAWVFSIARRAAIDVYRRERRLPATVDVPPELAADTFSVEQLWQVWEVRRAVEALPADEAAVVRLAHYYQMTQSEIAAALGLPLGTVKSRSSRAHRRLAGTLAHLFAAEPAPPAEPLTQTAKGQR